jgi:hypothetical protein
MPDSRKNLIACTFLSALLHAAVLLAIQAGIGMHNSTHLPATATTMDGRERLLARLSDRKASPVISKELDDRPVPATTTSQNPHLPRTADKAAWFDPTDQYLPPSKLSEIPSPIDSLDPTPDTFRQKGLIGQAELLLLISESGNVDDVLILESTLPKPILDYARNVFKGARFTAGRVNGQAVKSRIRIVLSVNPDTLPANAGNPDSAKSR